VRSSRDTTQRDGTPPTPGLGLMGVKKGSTDRVNSMPDCPRDSTLECNMQMRGVVFVGGEEAYRAAASTPLAAIEKVFWGRVMY
jgi:hypothetical protein